MELWISVHIPKTAGSSFLGALRSHFGDRIHLDSDNMLLQYPRWKRNVKAAWRCLKTVFQPMPPVECIHGHFLPFNYAWLGRRQNVRFITWLRDPIERLVSQYHHIQRRYDPARSRPMQRRVVEEQWTLEKFLFHPYYQNMYCQLFWRFRPERFDFIGIVEHYEQDIACLSGILGSPLAVYHENRNPKKDVSRYRLPDVLRQRAEQHHSRDMALYRKALEWRRRRLGQIAA